MPPSTARRGPVARAAGARAPRRSDDPVVIYVAGSLDGTSFALDPGSRERIREAFPGVRVSTRRVFISHDTREAFDQTVGRFESQIAVLLTGVQAHQLGTKFRAISFRDPTSEREINRLPVLPEQEAQEG